LEKQKQAEEAKAKQAAEAAKLKAVAENELKPIADIKLEKYENNDDKVEVVFTIPVLPVFELGQYKGVEVEKENVVEKDYEVETKYVEPEENKEE